MTTPEQLLLAKRRSRILDEETAEPLVLDSTEDEHTGVKYLINRLGVIRVMEARWNKARAIVLAWRLRWNKAQ